MGLTGHASSYSMEQAPEIVEALRKETLRIEEECAALISRLTH